MNNQTTLEERLWGRLAVRSLAKHWHTPEEDQAWVYLQQETYPRCFSGETND